MASKNKTEERISEITPEMPETAVQNDVIALNGNSNLERFVNKLYRVSYYAGVEAIRTVNQLKRSILYNIKNNALTRYLKTGKLYKKITTAILGFAEDVLTPFVRAGVKFKKTRERIKEKRSESFSAAFAETIRSIAGGLGDLWRCIVGVSNYIAPVFGILLLIATINFFNGLSFGLEVEYGGKTLGYIRNETEFQKADQMMQERIVYGDGDEPVYNIPTFRAAIVNEDEFTSTEDLCDEIIKVSGSSVIEAAGLYVDDKFYGAVLDRNKDSLSNVLNGLIDKNRTGEENEKVFFAQNVRLVDGLYPQQSIANYTDLTKLVTSEVEGERKYTVESGDSAWSIAQATDVSVSDLLLNNPVLKSILCRATRLLFQRHSPFYP